MVTYEEKGQAIIPFIQEILGYDVHEWDEWIEWSERVPDRAVGFLDDCVKMVAMSNPGFRHIRPGIIHLLNQDLPDDCEDRSAGSVSFEVDYRHYLDEPTEHKGMPYVRCWTEKDPEPSRPMCIQPHEPNNGGIPRPDAVAQHLLMLVNYAGLAKKADMFTLRRTLIARGVAIEQLPYGEKEFKLDMIRGTLSHGWKALNGSSWHMDHTPEDWGWRVCHSRRGWTVRLRAPDTKSWEDVADPERHLKESTWEQMKDLAERVMFGMLRHSPSQFKGSPLECVVRHIFLRRPDLYLRSVKDTGLNAFLDSHTMIQWTTPTPGDYVLSIEQYHQKNGCRIDIRVDPDRIRMTTLKRELTTVLDDDECIVTVLGRALVDLLLALSFEDGEPRERLGRVFEKRLFPSPPARLSRWTLKYL